MTITREWIEAQRGLLQDGWSCYVTPELLDLALIGLAVKEAQPELVDVMARALTGVYGRDWEEELGDYGRAQFRIEMRSVLSAITKFAEVK